MSKVADFELFKISREMKESFNGMGQSFQFAIESIYSAANEVCEKFCELAEQEKLRNQKCEEDAFNELAAQPIHGREEMEMRILQYNILVDEQLERDIEFIQNDVENKIDGIVNSFENLSERIEQEMDGAKFGQATQSKNDDIKPS